MKAAKRRWLDKRLTAAIEADSAELVEFWIDAGADINPKDATQIEPLVSFAACHSYNKALKKLLERGANPSVKSVDGRTPICTAADCLNDTGIRLLMKYGANIADVGLVMLKYLSNEKSFRTVDLIQSYGFRFSDESATNMFFECAEADNIETLKYLVKHGYWHEGMRNENGDSLLFISAFAESKRTVRYLLKNDMELDDEDVPLLLEISACSKTQAIHKLIEQHFQGRKTK